ncbi:MAG: hypothetical protein M3178_15540 [Pseudomonadota bacterium]|nr:hypothetical protein [Pseudomonadota bacterium]
MQGHAILSGQDRLAQRGLGWTAAIIACLSSLALSGLGQPVTAQDSSVRILTPPPVAQMFRIGPNGTPAASATLSTLNSIVREPRGLASSGEVGLDLDLDITYTESTIYTPGKPDIPHCFNQTNLHSHGLWVSPAGNSDNVLVNISARR